MNELQSNIERDRCLNEEWTPPKTRAADCTVVEVLEHFEVVVAVLQRHDTHPLCISRSLKYLLIRQKLSQHVLLP